MMPGKKQQKIYSLILCFLLFLFTPLGFTETPVMPLSEVKPGMLGYGLSVFQGSTIERFQVEVVDILRGFLPAQDIILVRCLPVYQKFDLNRSGLIAGMSGSPVYIDGKMVGAVAYGWSDTVETLAGVTPLESMLAITKRPLSTQAAAPKTPSLVPSGTSQLVPLQAPLVVSGATTEALRNLQKIFEPMGFLTIAGGGGVPQALSQGARFEPGSSIGAQLMNGDLDVTAIGTVTWVEGNELLAFGHPFLNTGELRIPITHAHIATIMQSRKVSFKLGYATGKAGTIYQDRLPGLYARTDKDCPMIPVAIKIRNKIQNVERAFSVSVINHSFFTPVLCNTAIENFLDLQESAFGENSTSFLTKVYIKGKEKPLSWSNSEVYPTKTTEYLSPLLLLYKNTFEKVEIERMEFSIEITNRLEAARLSTVKTYPMEVEAGKKFTLSVSLLPQYRPEEKVSIDVEIPSFMPPGRHMMLVMSGAKIQPDLFAPEDSAGYLEYINKLNIYKANQILVALPVPKLILSYRGGELAEMPPSILGSLLPTNQNKDTDVKADIAIVAKDTSYVLSGVMQLFITVTAKKN